MPWTSRWNEKGWGKEGHGARHEASQRQPLPSRQRALAREPLTAEGPAPGSAPPGSIPQAAPRQLHGRESRKLEAAAAVERRPANR